MSSGYYVAVRGMPLAELVDALGFAPTNDDSDYCAYEGLDGWSIVANEDGIDLPLYLEWDEATLSAGRELMTYVFQTTAGVHELQRYEDGAFVQCLSSADNRLSCSGPAPAPSREMKRAHRNGDLVHHAFTDPTGIRAIAWSGDAPELRSYAIAPRTKEQVLPRTRFLSIDGGEERAIDMAALYEALARFAKLRSVRLSVLFDGRRRTLSASYEFGELQVVAVGDGRFAARGEGPLTSPDAVLLFEHFYDAGARAPTYGWDPL